MGFLNQFTAIGRPITDVVYGYTKEANVPYAYFMFAIPSYTTLHDGNPSLVNPDDVIQCRAFKKTAKVIGKYIEKGEMVALTGAIKLDKVNNRVYFWVQEVFMLKNYMKQKNSYGRRFYRRYDEQGNPVRIYVDEDGQVYDIEQVNGNARYVKVEQEREEEIEGDGTT
jgi:hypothetical protein